MPDVSYKAVPINYAIARGWPGVDVSDEDYDGWQHVLYRYEDGDPVELLARDGGEPEDNSFVRDGSWIAPALQDAYALGKAHGG